MSIAQRVTEQSVRSAQAIKHGSRPAICIGERHAVAPGMTVVAVGLGLFLFVPMACITMFLHSEMGQHLAQEAPGLEQGAQRGLGLEWIRQMDIEMTADTIVARHVIAAGRTSVTPIDVLRLAALLWLERWENATIDQLLGLVPVAAQAREEA